MPWPPRLKPGEEYLKGPIPGPWLFATARLPGKALAVALLLCHLSSMRRTRVGVLSMKRLAKWGIHRNAAYRALKAMEQAGLVKVERHVGRLSRVTLLDTPEALRSPRLRRAVLFKDEDNRSPTSWV